MLGDIFFLLFTFGEIVVALPLKIYREGLDLGFYTRFDVGERGISITIFLPFSGGISGFNMGSELGCS